MSLDTVDSSCKAEIYYFHGPIVDKDIFGFQVSVDKSEGMYVDDGLHHVLVHLDNSRFADI